MNSLTNRALPSKSRVNELGPLYTANCDIRRPSWNSKQRGSIYGCDLSTLMPSSSSRILRQ